MHLIWEGVLGFFALLMIVIVLVVMGGVHLGTTVLSQASVTGLIACSLALSLRTGTPNLAVGSIAVFSGGIMGLMVTDGGWALPIALIVTLIAATVLGVLISLAVVALSMPSWAVSLACAALVEMVLVGISEGRTPPVLNLGTYPTGLWFALFLIVSIGGGLLWQVRGMREPLSASRTPGEPGKWIGKEAAIGTIAGITGSSLLAGIGGIALIMRLTSTPGVSGQMFTIAAFAAALLGGVSLYGRRAGVAGTALAVLIITAVISLMAYNGSPIWLTNVVVAVFALLGLAVTRVLEAAAKSMEEGAAKTGSSALTSGGGPSLRR